MGPAPIEIPDYFTLAYYRQQKECGKTDQDIADDEHVSYCTLAKWKKEIGWVAGAGMKYVGRKKEINREEVARMRRLGVKQIDIAISLGIPLSSVERILKEMGMTKQRKVSGI